MHDIKLFFRTKIANGLFFLLLILLFSSCTDKETTSPNEESSYFFTDDFETGDHSKTKNGFKWSDNTVEIDETPNGTMGLKIVFGPDKLHEDSWREQRFHLGNEYAELWVKYDLYVPANYHHRCPVKLILEVKDESLSVGDTVLKVKSENGNYSVPNEESWGIVTHILADTVHVDQLPHYHTLLDDNEFKNKRTGTISKVAKRLGYSHNNKFFVVWQGNYGHSSSGNTINLSSWYGHRGSSTLSYSPAKDHGAWQLGHEFTETHIFDKETDPGKWMEIIIHLKIAGSANNDGIIKVWKNGQEFLNVTDLANHSDLGFNYFQYGYLLGWSNSGFEEETIMYIDNVVFSSDKISSSVK